MLNKLSLTGNVILIQQINSCNNFCFPVKISCEPLIRTENLTALWTEELPCEAFLGCKFFLTLQTRPASLSDFSRRNPMAFNASQFLCSFPWLNVKQPLEYVNENLVRTKERKIWTKPVDEDCSRFEQNTD